MTKNQFLSKIQLVLNLQSLLFSRLVAILRPKSPFCPPTCLWLKRKKWWIHAFSQGISTKLLIVQFITNAFFFSFQENGGCSEVELKVSLPDHSLCVVTIRRTDNTDKVYQVSVIFMCKNDINIDNVFCFLPLVSD